MVHNVPVMPISCTAGTVLMPMYGSNPGGDLGDLKSSLISTLCKVPSESW